MCYGSTAIIHFNFFQWGIDFSRQILTSKIGPRAEKVKTNTGRCSVSVILYVNVSDMLIKERFYTPNITSPPILMCKFNL